MICLEQDRKKCLQEKFGVDGFPSLVVLSPTCEIITKDGVTEVHVASDDALRKWSDGKRLFWSCEAKQGEYVWKYCACSKCFLSPIIGTRYGCLNRECHFDLCESCLTKTTHEHRLIEYLIPKKQYSFEQLFESVPYLLKSDNNEKIETKTLWNDCVKSIGFYFATARHPFCRDFTSKLVELYKEAQKRNSSFRLIFISCDRDEESFDKYRVEMPWPAVPLDVGAVFKTYFPFFGSYRISIQYFYD